MVTGSDSFLGEGGFGTVFSATEKVSGIDVAIKIVYDKWLDENEKEFL
jgi:serine/threonine protein kinase